jgi:hypothetical protein
MGTREASRAATAQARQQSQTRQTWQTILDAELRSKDACALIVCTGEPGPERSKITNYVLTHTRNTSALVYTGVRALRDQISLHQNGLIPRAQLSKIRVCGLLVLLLEDACWAADAQYVSVQLDLWLHTFGLTQTKVLIFSPQRILVLRMPARHFRFVCESSEIVLAPPVARLLTNDYDYWDYRGCACTEHHTCPVHASVPWQTVVNNLMVADGPKAICIRGKIKYFYVHMYTETLLELNPGGVVLYRTVAEAKSDCFPCAERKKFMQGVRLVIVNLQRLRDTHSMALLAKQTHTILRHLDCEFPRETQFLIVVQRQPEIPQHWSILSMDTRAKDLALTPAIKVKSMLPSAIMTPGYEPVHNSVLSSDEYDSSGDEEVASDFDEMQFELSDAESVPNDASDASDDDFAN